MVNGQGGCVTSLVAPKNMMRSLCCTDFVISCMLDQVMFEGVHSFLHVLCLTQLLVVSSGEHLRTWKSSQMRWRQLLLAPHNSKLVPAKPWTIPMKLGRSQVDRKFALGKYGKVVIFEESAGRVNLPGEIVLLW